MAKFNDNSSQFKAFVLAMECYQCSFFITPVLRKCDAFFGPVATGS